MVEKSTPHPLNLIYPEIHPPKIMVENTKNETPPCPYK
jgi:hypothetical protein